MAGMVSKGDGPLSSHALPNDIRNVGRIDRLGTMYRRAPEQRLEDERPFRLDLCRCQDRRQRRPDARRFRPTAGRRRAMVRGLTKQWQALTPLKTPGADQERGCSPSTSPAGFSLGARQQMVCQGRGSIEDGTRDDLGDALGELLGLRRQSLKCQYVQAKST